MPSQNKYEIRSQDVQEVLSTPPRFLTFWGTALIVVVLIIGILLLSNFKISQTKKFPAQVIGTKGMVGILIDSALSSQIKVKQSLTLQLKNDNFHFEGSIDEIIDTSINSVPKKILFISEYSSSKLQDKLALTGVLYGETEIQIGKISLYQLFSQKKNIK